MTSPRLPLPAPLCGCDPGSFASRTLSVRLPGIARRVLLSRGWHDPARQRLQALVDEMPHGRLRPLEDSQAPDAAAWQSDLLPYLGLSWLDAPWFVAETYFFRRVLEATGYYQRGPGYHLDPYLPEKQQEFSIVTAQASELCRHLDGCAERTDRSHAAAPAIFENTAQRLAELLRHNIWGNQADRSMWPAGARLEGPSHDSANTVGELASRSDAHLLVDHSEAVAQFLAGCQTPLARIDLVLDNGGIELAYDLVLVDVLLRQSLVREVRLHAKPHPTYVSDVAIPDVDATLGGLERSPEPCLRDLANRLRAYLEAGKLQLRWHYYWTSPHVGWEMPAELRLELAASDLVISKGDANYRRWLGDRHWPHTTPIEQILAYFPVPLVALRVLKANLIAGLPGGLSEKMDALDPEWLVNGKWGIIQAAGLPETHASDL